MSDNKRMFILAHMYAGMLLREYNGSYKRAFQIGLIKAKKKMHFVCNLSA
jgi:hypothetical protein